MTKPWQQYKCCRCGATRKSKVRYWSEHEIMQQACLCEICFSETGTDLKEKEYLIKRKEQNERQTENTSS